MKIYVCVKHVPDSAATITIRGAAEIETGITFLMNPYDEHAVTEARRLKAEVPDSEVIAVSLASAAAESTLRSALAMGADRAILVVTEKRPDPMLTARALHAAITQDGNPDLILTGKESIDSTGMQTMFRLARHFKMPAAGNVVSLVLNPEGVQVRCETEAGAHQRLQLRLPCVLAAGKGLNTPRYPTFPDIVKSRKKPISTQALEQLRLPPPTRSTEILKLTPAQVQRTPKPITGTPESIARQLITILREEARVI